MAQSYEPVNYDGRFHGPVRIRPALANSYNVPAILLLQDIGVPRFLDFAREWVYRPGKMTPAAMVFRLTLGGAEVTPLDLTAAYAHFCQWWPERHACVHPACGKEQW